MRLNPARDTARSEPQIAVVDAEAAAGVRVGELKPCAEVRGNLAGVENAQLLREAGGAVLGDAGQSRVREVGQRSLELRVGDLRHDREGRGLRQLQQLFLLARDVAHLLQVDEEITARLEHAPEVSEFRIDRVTGLAGHSRLPGKARYGKRSRRCGQGRHHRQTCRAQQFLVSHFALPYEAPIPRVSDRQANSRCSELRNVPNIVRTDQDALPRAAAKSTAGCHTRPRTPATRRSTSSAVVYAAQPARTRPSRS
jgi:hypothetical protein